MNIKEIHTQEKPVSAISLFKSDQGNATAIQILQGEKLKEHWKWKRCKRNTKVWWLCQHRTHGNTLGWRNRTKSIGADQVKNLKHEVSKYSQT